MATTSLWRVKGRIGRVIDYIENPDKTSEKPPDPGGGKATIRDVLDYVTRDAATDHSRLVTAINCHLETASEEMRKTKADFGKPGGTIAYHGYQSFKEGEVTPEKAHMIGCRLAEELWGGRYEVIVATHVDKETHIHNHYVINTVSFVDGKKFHRTKEDYRRMREVSDRLCRENSLSVVRHPEDGKGRNYGEWLAEQNGKPTWRSMIRRDIDRAIRASVTERDFLRYMEELGYEFKLYTTKGEPLMRPSLKPKDSVRYFRFDRLGEGEGRLVLLQSKRRNGGERVVWRLLAECGWLLDVPVSGKLEAECGRLVVWRYLRMGCEKHNAEDRRHSLPLQCRRLLGTINRRTETADNSEGDIFH